MEPKFQTSFIPKKQTAPVSMGGMGSRQLKPKQNSSIFMLIAVIIFVISLAGVGGAYMWKQYLISSQEKYKTQLAAKEKQFNIDLIEKLKAADIKLGLAKQLISNHLAMSGVFELFGRLIIERVRLTEMNISIPENTNEIKITVSGYGVNLPAVAFQSDVLAQLETYGLRKIIKNPMMTTPSNDGTGVVTFGMSAVIDPSQLLYDKTTINTPPAQNP